MKKRLLSMFLVLSFVIALVPISVTAAETQESNATYTSVMSDWSAKIGGISAINDGMFQINAFDSSAAASLTNKKHARMAVWNGELAEGRFSVTLDTASILAGRGDREDHSGANDTGIVFGGKGIKAYAVPANGSVNNVENNSQFYFLYFSNSSISLALADKDNYIDEDGDGVKEKQKAWVGTQKNAAGKNLQTDLNKTHTAMWTAAKTAGKIEITVAFSATGAFRVWLNGEHIPELDADNLKPFGTELGIRNGMGYHVPTKIHDFKIYGGLNVKSLAGKIVYDPMTYKWSASGDAPYDAYTGDSAVGYVTNRIVTNGKVVIIAQQVPDVIHTATDKDCTVYKDGGVCTAGHYQNYYTGAIFNVTADGKSYYMLSMKDTQSTRGGAIGPGAVSIQTRISSVVNNKWTGDPTGVAWKVVQHVSSNPYSPADPITFNASTGKITWPSGTTANFNGTNASTYKVAEWTNPTPITGGFYGFRSDVYDDAYQAWVDSMNGKWPSTSPAVNANDGAWVQYYVVNNDKEAMDIDFASIALDETTGVYTATLNTFPAGSVINSGDSIKVSGANLQQLGGMTDKGDGVYEVQFIANASGADTANFSVDNHIFGTLSTSTTQEFVAHEHFDDYEADNDNHWIDCNCGQKLDLGAHDKTGATDKIDATCTDNGTLSYVTCPTCDTTLYEKADGTWAILENEDDLIIPATGHVNTTDVKETPAGCESTGTKAHKLCACGVILLDGVVVDASALTIPATGHINLTPVTGTSATCKTEGMLAHDKCACGALILNGEKVDESALVIAIDPANHTGNNTVDYDGQYHWDVCECGEIVSDKIAHTYANGKDGVCTAGCGYTQDHVCAYVEHVDAKPATCIEKGIVEHWICECGIKYLDEACKNAAESVEIAIDADNHVIDLETTAWTAGEQTHYKACTCGAKLAEEAHEGLDCTVCLKKTYGVYKVGTDLYFREWGDKNLTGKFYVTTETGNELVPEGWYYADENGKFIKEGFFNDKGTLRYIVDGQTVYTQVTNINGKLYMIDWDGKVLTGKFYITADSANGLTTEGWHYTNADGSFIENGFYDDVDCRRYIVNGKTAHTRVTEIDGKFYMIDWDGEVKTGKFYITADSLNGYLNGEGWYYADENGNFYHNAFYTDGNVKRYILNGKAAYTRLTEINGDYYMIEWDGVVVINTEKFYITASSSKGQLKGAGWYKTDADGKIIVE